jgi:hypothetical protein
MPIRFLIVSLLVLLGGILSVPAAIAIWQEREIQDEDAFVQNVSDVFTDESVQELTATRLTQAIMTRTDFQQRIVQGLENLEEDRGAPPSTSLLAGPLTRVATETVYELCLRFLQADEFQQVLEAAARATHRAVMAVVNNDRGVLDTSNGQVVLNLRPVILRVVEELAGERGEEALSKLNIPEDAGTIVISEEQEHPWLWDLVQWLDDFNPVVPIITAVLFLLAILIAKSKRRAIIATGATLSLVAGLALLALAVPLKELATTWPPTPEGQEAAEQVYDILLDSFRRMELFVFILGLAMVVIGSVAGDRRVVQALRSAATRRQEEDVDAGGLVRERAGALRLAGLALAGVILIVWPDPTLRTVIAVGAILAGYLAIIWLLASDSDLAQRSRERTAEGLWSSRDLPIQRRTGFVGWLAVHAGILRLLSVAAGACLLLFVWDLSLGGFVFIAAAVLLLLAVIEWASTAARQPPESAAD